MAKIKKKEMESEHSEMRLSGIGDYDTGELEEKEKIGKSCIVDDIL